MTRESSAHGAWVKARIHKEPEGTHGETVRAKEGNMAADCASMRIQVETQLRKSGTDATCVQWVWCWFNEDHERDRVAFGGSDGTFKLADAKFQER